MNLAIFVALVITAFILGWDDNIFPSLLFIIWLPCYNIIGKYKDFPIPVFAITNIILFIYIW